MTRVLQFPTPVRVERPVLAWFRCAGGCDALVGGPAQLCLSCAVREVPA
jgi:hypothetical protein